MEIVNEVIIKEKEQIEEETEKMESKTRGITENELIQHFGLNRKCFYKQAYRDSSKASLSEFKMSKHPINFEGIKNASQDKIENIIIPRLWERQTEDEKSNMETIYLNCKGFSKPDAYFFGLVIKKLKNGEHLNERELENSRRRLCRYTNQLLNMKVL